MAAVTPSSGPVPARRSRGRCSSWIDIALFATGTGLFAFLIHRVGAASIARALVTLGPALPLIVGVEALAVLANTLSWRCTIPPARRADVPFGRLVAARIVGDAVSYVIPAGAGEIPKVRFLSRYIPTEVALVSVALAKLTEGIALGLFALLGLAAAWPMLVTSRVSAVTIVVVAAAGVGLVAAGLVAARAGVSTAVIRLFRRLVAILPDRPRSEVAGSPAVAETPSRQEGLVASTAWYLVGWLVNVAELWLACHFLALRASVRVVFAGEALGALFDAIFFFVPMRIGAAEGGRVFVFRLLGFSAEIGLTLGLVRRIRELVWTVAGLAIYPWLARVDKAAPGHEPARDRRDTAVAT
jgi:Lysylphosphatidylglycerol synthase TM region